MAKIEKGPECPVCRGGMTLRHRGRDGKPFWGCEAFPSCMGAVDAPGESWVETPTKKLEKKVREGLDRARAGIQANRERIAKLERQVGETDLRKPTRDEAGRLEERLKALEASVAVTERALASRAPRGREQDREDLRLRDVFVISGVVWISLEVLSRCVYEVMFR